MLSLYSLKKLLLGRELIGPYNYEAPQEQFQKETVKRAAHDHVSHDSGAVVRVH